MTRCRRYRHWDAKRDVEDGQKPNCQLDAKGKRGTSRMRSHATNSWRHTRGDARAPADESIYAATVLLADGSRHPRLARDLKTSRPDAGRKTCHVQCCYGPGLVRCSSHHT